MCVSLTGARQALAAKRLAAQSAFNHIVPTATGSLQGCAAIRCICGRAFDGLGVGMCGNTEEGGGRMSIGGCERVTSDIDLSEDD